MRHTFVVIGGYWSRHMFDCDSKRIGKDCATFVRGLFLPIISRISASALCDDANRPTTEGLLWELCFLARENKRARLLIGRSIAGAGWWSGKLLLFLVVTASTSEWWMPVSCSVFSLYRQGFFLNPWAARGKHPFDQSANRKGKTHFSATRKREVTSSFDKDLFPFFFLFFTILV